jgi:hypothetical protein
MFFNCKTQEDIDRILLEGYNINFQDTIFGQTFLHCLVQSNSPLIDYALTKNPDLNIKNREGRSCIFYARNIETVEKLMLGKIKILEKDNYGKNAIEHNNYLRIYLIEKMKNGYR